MQEVKELVQQVLDDVKEAKDNPLGAKIYQAHYVNE
jgi:hypothetical protein